MRIAPKSIHSHWSEDLVAAEAGREREQDHVSVLRRDGVEEAERLADLEVLGRLPLEWRARTSCRLPRRWRARFGDRSGFDWTWPSLTASVSIPHSGMRLLLTLDSLRPLAASSACT